MNTVLQALELRKARNKDQKQIDNSSLPAGSPMYYYCTECGDPSDTLPENYIGIARTLCWQCQDLKNAGLIA